MAAVAEEGMGHRHLVEHFHANVAYLLDGKAKAMIVTASRKAAVKYKQATDAYIAKWAAEGASYNYRTLVAFGAADLPVPPSTVLSRAGGRAAGTVPG